MEVFRKNIVSKILQKCKKCIEKKIIIIYNQENQKMRCKGNVYNI